MVTAETFRQGFVELLKLIDNDIAVNSSLYNGLSLGFIVILSLSTLIISRIVLNSVIKRWILKTRTEWDDALHDHGFFKRLIHLVPALVIFVSTHVLLTEDSLLFALLLKTSLLYLMSVAALSVSALLNTFEDWYNTTPFAAQASITGFIQVAKLVLAILFTLLSVSLIVECIHRSNPDIDSGIIRTPFPF